VYVEAMTAAFTTSRSVSAVARAAGVLRAGAALAIRDANGAIVLVQAVETADDAGLASLRNAGAVRLVLTHERAATLKIRLYTPDVVALPVAADARMDWLRTIADPTADLAAPLKGPFQAERVALPQGLAAAVKLTKLAGLLPAVVAVAVENAPPGVMVIAADDITGYDDEIVRTLTLVARTRVPLDGAEKTEIAAFRPADGGPEHYAIIIGAPSADGAVLTRLHSECFTGDLLGSLKCDCGEQLRGAIKLIANSGGGILLYLAQEGRGIGLINKLRAYRLQDQGFDTMDANERLGFAADERRFGIAARMLTLLGYSKIRLLTNNPFKVEALTASGITVAERVPHAFASNRHNHAYLAAKAEKGGHLL
jgi:GTP cyclohydrolase II